MDFGSIGCVFILSFCLWNGDIAHSLRTSEKEMDRKQRKDKKEADYFAKKASKISVIDITAEDIEDGERILIANNLCHAMRGKKYLFYSKKRLDELLENMIDSFSHDYLGEEYA